MCPPGLLHLHGPGRRLKHLSLHSNRLGNIKHLLQCLLGLQGLREVLLSQGGKDNPLCGNPGYRKIVMQSLPQLALLDGVDRLGQLSHYMTDSPGDVPGLENYVDLLLLSDGCQSEPDTFVTPPSMRDVLANQVARRTPSVHEERVKKLEQQVSRLVQQASARQKSSHSSEATAKTRKTANCGDCTSESDCDSGKENGAASIAPKSHKAVVMRTSKRSSGDYENPKQRVAKPTVRWTSTTAKGGADAPVTTRRFTQRGAKEPIDAKSKSGEVETYKAILEERDQERERRWKAEQVVTKLTDELKCLKTKVSEEKDLQSMAMHTTDRLKDLLLKERSTRCELERRVEQLDARCRSLSQQLEQARSGQERHQHKLRQLEEDIAHGEALQARQQAHEMKRQQELENEVSTLKRDLDIQKTKVQQLQELLACREQEHRKQLEMRLQPGGLDFQSALAKELASERQALSRRESEVKDKVEESKKAYAALEDEFRLALTMEAARFNELKKTCDQMSAELPELKLTLAQSQQMEKKSSCMVEELTKLVKEQKSRISELHRAKRDALTEFKRRAQSLEADLDQDRRMRLQLDSLKKDKTRLASQVGAQESVIDGLRAERKLWGQELAQQGAFLAQDRGRMEAKIEALVAQVEVQKNQMERDRDALKIKGKIMEDQTETIRKLKENLQERDEQLHRLRDDKALDQKTFQRQLEAETSRASELGQRVEHLELRKEELKQQLEEKMDEIDEVKKAHGESSKKWQEKAQLLTQLENQVKRMKDIFESKERSLTEENEQVSDAHRAAMEKLRCVDDTFRMQIEALQAAHQAELLQLTNEKHDHIAEANHKVFEVEEEMRQLLLEVDAHKRITEEKMKRLNSVLKDFNW
ncbi:leucine-rich repeat and coiled-coil domain-containing protein 1 isoform X2 [Stigmatopora nigra]